MLHQLLLVIGSWEGIVIKRLGAAQSVWQWQLQGGCVLRGVRAIMCGAWLQCPFFFLLTPEVTGAAGGTHSLQSLHSLQLSSPELGEIAVSDGLEHDLNSLLRN